MILLCGTWNAHYPEHLILMSLLELGSSGLFSLSCFDDGHVLSLLDEAPIRRNLSKHGFVSFNTTTSMYL